MDRASDGDLLRTWRRTRPHNLIAAGFSHGLRRKGRLERAGVRDHPAAGLMLPVTVQFLVAMLAYGLNERMVRKADYLREENRILKEALLLRITYSATQAAHRGAA